MTSATSQPISPARGAPRPGPALLTPADLAELMTAFNDVTTRLEATHEQLRAEVSRLNGELREANERLRRSERLAELGEMAAGIAHEIRNPLGSISLYSEVLAGDLASLGVGDADGPCGTARKIGAAVRRLDAIVRDVLDFARDLRVRPEPIDPADLFDEATESPRAGGPDVFERLDRRPGTPAAVWCDRSLGLQALLNVIENARQATPDDPASTVTLDARRVTLRGTGGEAVPGVALIVADRGPGIDPGVLDRVFNPFFTTREAGTGLGLAIVHRIVDAHGGGVMVRNNSDGAGGRGTTVELRFPDARGDETGTQPDRRGQRPAETERQG